EPMTTQFAGKHGGNMDQPIVTVGSKVLLPVYVEGANFFLGDVHASQGDGELSGIALETPATVKVKVTVVKGAAPEWPWVRHGGFVSICIAAPTFEEASRIALDHGIRLLEEQKGMYSGDALALLSVTSNLRIGAYWGAPQMTTRLEIPEHLGVQPVGL